MSSARSKIRARMRRPDVSATHVLVGLAVDEVSLVDYPANNRPWCVVKHARISKTADGRRVVEPETSPEPVAAETPKSIEDQIGERAASLFKALNVNERARASLENILPMIFGSLDRAYCLIYDADGTPYRGTLDAAIGGEIAIVADRLMSLAVEFGVTELPTVEGEAEPITMAKAHYMGKRRMKELMGAVLRLNEMLAELGLDLAEFAEAESADAAKAAPDAGIDSGEPSAEPVVEEPAAHADISAEILKRLDSMVASFGDRLAAVETAMVSRAPSISKASLVRPMEPAKVMPVTPAPAPAPKQPSPTSNELPFGRDPV